MAKKIRRRSQNIMALKINQWLDEWDQIPFDPKDHKAKPEPFFYMFTLPAADLKSLSGIYRRTKKRSSSNILGIQRRHDKERSDEIGKFIQYGFPWSVLSDTKRDSGEYDDLRKPGWLPTAIVVNILKKNDKRIGTNVSASDLINISNNDPNSSIIKLPQNFDGSNWKPKSLPPIEVIDGQHRLWAFDEDTV